MAKRQALIEKLWLIGAILVDLADDILDETFEILKVGAEWLVDLAGGLVTVVDWILDHISCGITYFGILFLRRVHDTRMSLIQYRRQIENGAFYFIVSGLAIAFLFSHYINYSYSYNGRTMGIVREQKDVLEVLDLASEELTQEYGLKVAIDGDSDIIQEGDRQARQRTQEVHLYGRHPDKGLRLLCKRHQDRYRAV